MSKINILQPSVFNKIAAGEVVERPASIVKELVENSIDAGATEISVSVVDGGISQIIVSDNGSGIEGDQLVNAFLPHATSKIAFAEDLENVLTLGFRGEALASIASVSEVVMVSRTKDFDAAALIEIVGGEVIRKEETGAPVGTEVRVKNLFFNMPVRYRFLRKPKQEESSVSEIISRLILANPNLAISYSADGRTVYQSNGKGLSEAIYAVYGSSTMQNIIPVKSTRNNIKIEGFVCKPNFAKPNTTYQTIVINGRFVESPLVSRAVSRIYEDYLMKRAYPFFVLHLTMPNENLDVNVHPNKLEVRFRDSQPVFGAVMHAVDDALLENRKSGEDDIQPMRMQATNVRVAPAEKPAESVLGNMVFGTQAATPSLAVQSQPDEVLTEIVLESTQKKADIKEVKPVFNQSVFEGMLKNIDPLAVKIVGKIFNTFIIVEIEDGIYLIDQHAAHERLLYDRLVLALKKGEFSTQPLLVPFVVEVNNTERQFMVGNLHNIERLGFEIEEFGNNSFKVSSIPYHLGALKVGEFFNDVLKDMTTILSLETKDLVADRLAQTACKHAVKGGDDLSKEEIVSLLENVARDKTSLQCPHGRPFVVEISRTEVDKWFKRIL